VVQVYEVGAAQGQTFVVMELVKGRALVDWMHQQPELNWQRCVDVYLQAGAGLVAAHEQGLIHRDFKPGNAIIDDKGRVRVLDFGLARYAQDNPPNELLITDAETNTDSPELGALQTSLTAAGSIVGTPAYMPPEQMLGGEVDARSDQFSFCVSLWEALYGERPFSGNSMAALMLSVRTGAIQTPPNRARVPTPIRAVLLRGLAPDPNERWPSMEALLEQLRRRAAPRRRRVMLVATTVGLLAVGGGLGSTRALEWLHRCTGARAQLAGIWDEMRRDEVKAAIVGVELPYALDSWERVRPRLDAYAEAWAAEHTDACEATRSRGEQSEDDMSLRMGCLHRRRVHLRAMVGELARADATVVENAAQAVASLPELAQCQDLEALRADVSPPADPAVAEQVIALDEVLAEATAKQDAGKYEDGLRLADEVVEKGGTLDYEPLMARAWLRQGHLRKRVGDYTGAVEVLRLAYGAAVAHNMLAEAAETSVQLMFVLGHSLDRHDDARSWARNAEPLSRAIGTDGARASYLSTLGAGAYSQGRYEDAQNFFARALAISEKAFGPQHSRVGDLLDNLGGAARSLGNYQQARDYYDRALAIKREALGPQHPHVGFSLGSLSDAAFLQGDYEYAGESLERALAIFENALGPQHPHVASSLSDLGRVAKSQQRYDEARDYYERALAIRELGGVETKIARSLNNLGTLSTSQGDYEDARDYFERALAILETMLDPRHPDVAVVLDNLGVVLTSQGQHASAHDLLERALVIRREALGPQHPNVAMSLNNLGHLAFAREAYADARDLFERALAILEKALGPRHPHLAVVLTGLGETLVELALPVEALPLLERSLTIYTAHEADPASLAEARFVLARALWSAPPTQGRDRPRACALAERARDGLATTEGPAASGIDPDEVDAWLATHRAIAPSATP
ncbi:MAG: serine/threonine-protein kinase, partial [Deltaproteobacteria bacterium]|nr:serine/threonine-protein kinase [Deltaproteobacteria bacterium]